MTTGRINQITTFALRRVGETAHAVVAHDLAGRTRRGNKPRFPLTIASLQSNVKNTTDSARAADIECPASPRCLDQPSSRRPLSLGHLFSLSLVAQRTAFFSALRARLDARRHRCSRCGTLLSTYIPRSLENLFERLALSEKTPLGASYGNSPRASTPHRKRAPGDRLATAKIRNVHPVHQLISILSTFPPFSCDRQETFAYLSAASCAPVASASVRSWLRPPRNSIGTRLVAQHRSLRW
ncbi:MAG: hypothetical protein GY922_16500 [Proteobacteria bacterium]|nr:hypothetical protein [Pseudomonadota bacterium]